MDGFKITTTMDLERMISELHEVAMALDECADHLKMIDTKYKRLSEADSKKEKKED